MLHELFITHCTNGTSIMNPFTLIFSHCSRIFSFSISYYLFGNIPNQLCGHPGGNCVVLLVYVHFQMYAVIYVVPFLCHSSSVLTAFYYEMMYVDSCCFLTLSTTWNSIFWDRSCLVISAMLPLILIFHFVSSIVYYTYHVILYSMIVVSLMVGYWVVIHISYIAVMTSVSCIQCVFGFYYILYLTDSPCHNIC